MINYKTMQDEKLVELIQMQKSTEQCLDILIDRHSGLCIDMINSYMGRNSNSSIKHEFIKEKDYHIYNAALKYEADRGTKFTTYLGNEIKWKCLNLYNKSKKERTVSVEENLIDFFGNLFSQDKDSSRQETFENVINLSKDHPDKRVGKIFHLRYVVGRKNSVMPWKSISQELNMSIQGCINIHDAALQNIKHKIKNNKY